MSARDNPFRASRIDALTYRAPGFTWEELLSRIEQQAYRGALVGPHGQGKTTLMHSLREKLAARGFDVRYFCLNEATPYREADARAILHDVSDRTVFLFDGAERLGWLQWRRLKRASKRAGGLIVTTHQPCDLPTLWSFETPELTFHHLVEELAGPVSPSLRHAASTAFQRHGGNVRAALFELYDQWAAGHAPSCVRGACPARRAS